MIDVREMGATRISFRKPNCRSQMIMMPNEMEEKSSTMPIIPGARNSLYFNPPIANTGFRPLPMMIRIREGKARLPMILLFERRKRLTSLSQSM